MPDLYQSLLGHDHGHLRIIAEHCGISLSKTDVRLTLKELVDKYLDITLVIEVLEALPEEAVLALRTLLSQNEGRIPWSQFTRRFGEIREMGPGRRDRERPDRSPASTSEVLWYRALVARAFFDTPRGTEEFAFIPDDLQIMINETFSGQAHPSDKPSIDILGRAAKSAERAFQKPATDRILDHACTLLAGLRIGADVYAMDPDLKDFIHSLLVRTGILDSKDLPDPEKTRTFLEASRGESLSILTQAWLDSPEHNDLLHTPNLLSEGEWRNNPLETRQFIIRALSTVPQNTWWNLSAFIADIHQHNPDFQRPAGDYDSWFIRDKRTGEFLRGFEHWYDVDGALIRYIITGPLHWLGILDLASIESDGVITAFKFSQWATRLLKNENPKGLAKEKALIYIRSDGRVNVPVLAPRAVRYQLARFCLWEGENIYEYRYRLSSSSLSKAMESGLKVSHLISLLQRYSDSIPPNILTALDRWEKHGTEVRLQEVTILRLGSPEILQALRISHAARYLGDPLGPTTVIIKPGAGEKVLAIMAEMGYFGEVVSNHD